MLSQQEDADMPEGLEHKEAFTHLFVDEKLFTDHTKIAAARSYNNTILSVGKWNCEFCGSRGHQDRDCPAKLELEKRWKYDEFRMRLWNHHLNILRREKLEKM